MSARLIAGYGSLVLYANITQECMKCIRSLIEDRRALPCAEDAYQIAKKYSWIILTKEYEKVLFNN